VKGLVRTMNREAALRENNMFTKQVRKKRKRNCRVHTHTCLYASYRSPSTIYQYPPYIQHTHPKDIAELVKRLKLDKDVSSLLDVMRNECYLLLKGPSLYQLQTAD
jgi:hypothetical protein